MAAAKDKDKEPAEKKEKGKTVALAVTLRNDKGEKRTFKPGDNMPAAWEKLVSNPAVFGDDDDE